MAAIK